MNVQVIKTCRQTVFNNQRQKKTMGSLTLERIWNVQVYEKEKPWNLYFCVCLFFSDCNCNDFEQSAEATANMIAGRCSTKTSCYLGKCWAYCGADLTSGSWCFTTKSSKNGKYATCTDDSECNTCWNCVGKCSILIEKHSMSSDQTNQNDQIMWSSIHKCKDVILWKSFDRHQCGHCPVLELLLPSLW